ncbi:MAG TPA: chorismate mutase [Candidatus Limnocylindria bacterium]|nr:chorismate mutase [Candidatus Limnocylindria bacterium]
MATRGIRGATTVGRNDRDEILAATTELLAVIVRLNGLRSEDVAYVLFTVTPDLDAEFPAFAARELGWTDVPLMCGQEIPVPGALERCIRVLVSWNTTKTQREVRHAFLHGAKELRPAWAVEV